MWRQGDVFIAPVACLPREATRRAGGVLVEGELTGHSHRLEKPGAAELWEHGDRRFLRVTAERAGIIHQEHGPILLVRGTYRVWPQREYAPGEIRRVLD